MTGNGNGNGKGNAFDELVAVNLSIRYWPGSAKLKPADLNLSAEDAPAEVFKLGQKRLYPPEWREKFQFVSGQARRYLDVCSFPFIMEAVQAVPKRNLKRVMEKLDGFKASFTTLAEEFLARYEEIIDGWREKYPELWPKLAPHYPTRAKLIDRFGFEVNVFEVKGMEVKEGDPVELIEAIERQKKELEAKAQAAMTLAYGKFMEKITETVSNLASRLKEGKIVKGKTLENVKNLSEYISEMNIFGDLDISKPLTELQAALEGVEIKNLKKDEELKIKLQEMAEKVVSMADSFSDVTGGGKLKRFIDLG